MFSFKIFSFNNGLCGRRPDYKRQAPTPRILKAKFYCTLVSYKSLLLFFFFLCLRFLLSIFLAKTPSLTAKTILFCVCLYVTVIFYFSHWSRKFIPHDILHIELCAYLSSWSLARVTHLDLYYISSKFVH